MAYTITFEANVQYTFCIQQSFISTRHNFRQVSKGISKLEIEVAVAKDDAMLHKSIEHVHAPPKIKKILKIKLSAVFIILRY